MEEHKIKLVPVVKETQEERERKKRRKIMKNSKDKKMEEVEERKNRCARSLGRLHTQCGEGASYYFLRSISRNALKTEGKSLHPKF